MSEPIEPPSLDPALLAVGQGIQAFANVEFGLSLVFASLMEPADRQRSVVALDAARHIETKLRIVRAVGEMRLQGEQYSTFNSFVNRIKRKSVMRHKLAHWTVSHWPGAQSIDEMKRWVPALVPPLHSVHHVKIMWGGEQPIHLAQITAFAKQCQTFSTDLFSFSNEIRGKP